MKKHILSYYAKKDADYQCSISSKNTKETRTIEQTDNDIMLSKKKGTIKTFSVENSDSDDAFILKCTDKLKDGTETIEGTLEADSSYAAGDNSDRMVRLMNTTALEFKAYEQVEKPYSANYDGKEPQSSFKTSGMY